MELRIVTIETVVGLERELVIVVGLEIVKVSIMGSIVIIAKQRLII